MKKIVLRILLILLTLIIATFILSACCAKNLDETRIAASPNFVDGKAKNRVETPAFTSDINRFSMFKRLFSSEGRPDEVPAVKTDLLALDSSEDIVIWLGHSSILLQVDGKRILIDPLLSEAAAPVGFVNKPFNGTGIYEAKDIPAVDYLIITHDHYDHLSKKTLKAIKDRVGLVICPLGVGKYLKKWGYAEDIIVEMDWDEDYTLGAGFTIHCLTAHHRSGRGLYDQNSTLWAAYLLETPQRKIYFSGDSGYGAHFKETGERFANIDLAFIENGQYNVQWPFSHMMPAETMTAAKDIDTKFFMPIHNSKFRMSVHEWNDPLIQLTALHDEDDGIILMTPMIGEKVPLWDEGYNYRAWWAD